MPAVVRDLVASPLAATWAMDVIPTYRQVSPVRRHVLAAVAALRLVRWCLGRGPRVVHIHSAARGSLYRKCAYAAIARALGRPVLFHVHAGAGDIDQFADRLPAPVTRIFRRALRVPNRVVSVSRASGDALARRFGIRDVGVVPNAAPRVDPALVAPPPDDDPEVLYLGGFEDPAKGGHVLVAALGHCPAFARVLLAGPGDAPVAVPTGATWLGWLAAEEKARRLAAAAIVVLPSVSEGLPVVLLEAMAYGRAIVASRVGGIPEVMTDGKDALLVPPHDPAALVRALRGLLADPGRRRELGAAARARALRLNDSDVAGRLDALYRELLARR